MTVRRSVERLATGLRASTADGSGLTDHRTTSTVRRVRAAWSPDGTGSPSARPSHRAQVYRIERRTDRAARAPTYGDCSSRLATDPHQRLPPPQGRDPDPDLAGAGLQAVHLAQPHPRPAARLPLLRPAPAQPRASSRSAPPTPTASPPRASSIVQHRRAARRPLDTRRRGRPAPVRDGQRRAPGLGPLRLHGHARGPHEPADHRQGQHPSSRWSGSRHRRRTSPTRSRSPARPPPTRPSAASCTFETTAEAFAPGAVKELRRSIWELGAIARLRRRRGPVHDAGDLRPVGATWGRPGPGGPCGGSAHAGCGRTSAGCSPARGVGPTGSQRKVVTSHDAAQPGQQ